ncbi:MAG: helicase-associated domain-containing protein, partial [Treponema sp.]|nr:helicase-associated domain-containing protein [Treponema sp.]
EAATSSSTVSTAISAVCFKLTRESVVRGFDQGLSAATMLEHLNRLSLNRLDENLTWTIKDWETRYAGVSLCQGIVLTLAEDRRYLAQARPLLSLVRQTLAPGVYLLSCADKAEAVQALRKAGVDIVAQPPDTAPSVYQTSGGGWFASSGSFRDSFYRLGSGSGIAGVVAAASDAQNKSIDSIDSMNAANTIDSTDAVDLLNTTESIEAIKQKFRRALEKKRFAKPEQDELEARIERRLILSEAQLDGVSLRYEKLEARGLDYAGKAAIAKQAIESGFTLDVSWPAPGGAIRHVTSVPLALEKKGGESILVLKAQSAARETAPNDARKSTSEERDASSHEMPPEEPIRVPLGKIILLRRIKQSIFGE